MIKKPNIIFLGAPGSGKGTIAKKLVEKYEYLHLSTGDLFRETLKHDTQLANQIKEYVKQGKLVPDEVTNNMMKQYIINAINNNKYFLLDGYPRTIDQAEFLKTICDIDLVIYLNISEELATKRIIGRRSCPKCGEIYNIYFKKPIKDNICDKCNTQLTQRKDDNEIVVKTRFQTYQFSTAPLIDYYQQQNKLLAIEVKDNTSDIFSIICNLIKK
ncbi:MAG: nucleoside monophosphate kinase [Mycoplasma sp.]|nr:nucleoside monophosphate kinase [Mycoplasma sp.]